jgi:hydrogenase nickel incorporation protein HypA/HybF
MVVSMLNQVTFGWGHKQFLILHVTSSMRRLDCHVMHELSIASSIVETVTAEMLSRGLTSIGKVGLRIGALTNVDPEALRFGYETMVVDTPLAGSTLEIESLPVKAVCRKCGLSFEAHDFIFICPNCESGDNEVTQGQELEIAFLEAE